VITGKGPFTSVKVVLADVTMLGDGADGGYFYNLNMNLPSSSGKGEDVYSFGNIGPFRVAGRQHHQHSAMAITLEYDITDLIVRRGKPDLTTHRFTLDRVSGNNSPQGEVLHIGEVRLELA
jgi:tyrosinase